jgi:hypothetical protein
MMVYNGRGISSGLHSRRLALMAQRFSRSLVRRVREHPLAFLYLLLALSAEAVALWLYSIDWGSSGIDVNRPAVAQAITMLGATFTPAMFWSLSFKGAGAEDTASSPDRRRVTRPSARVRRIALGVWVVMLVLAVVALVAALAGNREVALAVGYLVGWLNLIALVGGLVMRVSAVERQR